MANPTGSVRDPGSGHSNTVDICRGWRAECTGNGVSRRVLVGHYHGILMTCGQFAHRGLWMACRTHGWAEAVHTSSILSPLPCACIPSAAARRMHPMGPGLAQSACAVCLAFPYNRLSTRPIGMSAAGVGLETHSEQVSARHGGCLTLGEQCAAAAIINIPGPNGLRTTDQKLFVGLLRSLRWLFIDTKNTKVSPE